MGGSQAHQQKFETDYPPLELERLLVNHCRAHQTTVDVAPIRSVDWRAVTHFAVDRQRFLLEVPAMTGRCTREFLLLRQGGPDCVSLEP